MYVNNCLGYPSIVPVEFAVNYWTSYSAYHEAAFAALMNSKKVPSHIRESVHLANRGPNSPSRSGNSAKISSERNKSASPKFASHSVADRRTDVSPLCRLSSLSPPGESPKREINPPNRLLDFSRKNNHPQTCSSELKFGISRILSDDVGCKESEKEKPVLRSVREEHIIPTSYTCTSTSCPYVACRRVPPIPSSLSAVHALRPPQYPITTGSDALPGPYSILNTEAGCPSQPKRKRSWSRAVFSQLQRKGLEKRFEVQKYVTKPDRRQLAAMLGLTDAQVKVWFQNRRMKWRHAEKATSLPDTDKDGEEKADNGVSDGGCDRREAGDEDAGECVDMSMSDDEFQPPEFSERHTETVPAFRIEESSPAEISGPPDSRNSPLNLT